MPLPDSNAIYPNSNDSFWMVTEANVKVVQEFEAAAMRGDTEELLRLVAEDVVVHEAASLPYGGEHHGVDGLRHVFGSFLETWKFTAAVDFRVIDGGAEDVVVLVGESNVTARATGRTARFGVAEFYKVDAAGRIRDIRVFYSDTAAMLSALEPH
jgi:uncharacterized protein